MSITIRDHEDVKLGVVMANSHVIGRNNCNGRCLICETIIAQQGEYMVQQFFGPVCQALRSFYGQRCHEICRLFESDYERLALSYNPETANEIRKSDEAIIILDYKKRNKIFVNDNITNDADNAALISFKIQNEARAQAQLTEIEGQYNTHWTRVNLGFGKHHRLTREQKFLNFSKHQAPIDFPVRWNRMLYEIHDSNNSHYAWEKFCGYNPEIEPDFKELFWTYRMGRAIEYFGRQHPGLFKG